MLLLTAIELAPHEKERRVIKAFGSGMQLEKGETVSGLPSGLVYREPARE